MIEQIQWDEARKLALHSCPELLTIIDELSPNKQFNLVKVRYPFASLIADNHCLYLPINHANSVKIGDPRIDKKWQQLLGYNAVPLGIISRNSLEKFREIDDMIIPIALDRPNDGLCLGVAEAFGSTAAYTITSGARSLYMLPKITKTVSHKKLQRIYGIKSPRPKKLLDHWPIFKELYNSPAFESSWECEVLFLTNKWHEQLQKNDSAWQPFKFYLMQKAMMNYALGHRKVLLDIVWQRISNELKQKGLKPDPYVVDTLKHIIIMSLGITPGSRPSNGDNAAGPLNEIQNIYLNTYGLDDYIPTIMAPHSFKLEEDKPVYYSMQSPMLLSSTPNFRAISSNIEDMRELMQLMKYLVDIDYGNLIINNMPFNEHLKKISFNYYHADMYAYGREILSTKKIPDEDKGFLYQPKDSSQLKFADNGSYVRGCIKISKKSDL